MDNFSLDEQQQRLLNHLLTQSVGSDVSSPLYNSTPAPPGYTAHSGMGMSDSTGMTYNYGADNMGSSYYNYYQGKWDLHIYSLN